MPAPSAAKRRGAQRHRIDRQALAKRQEKLQRRAAASTAPSSIGQREKPLSASPLLSLLFCAAVRKLARGDDLRFLLVE